MESTKDSNVRIGLESTGHYSKNILLYLIKNILLYLIKQGYQTTLINPILTNMDRKASTVHKTKTDKIDAEDICKFLDKNRFDFKPYTLLSYHIDALKSLTRQRFYDSYYLLLKNSYDYSHNHLVNKYYKPDHLTQHPCLQEKQHKDL